MKLPLWGSALSATMLVQVVSSFAAAAVPLLGPILTQRWDMAPENIGYASAATSIGICWFLACGGPMLGHLGPIRTLQCGLVAIGLATILLSQPVAAVGLLGALLLGLGLAPNNPAGSAMLMRTAPPSHRNLIFSIRQAGVPLGGAIAGILIAPGVEQFGFDGAVWLIVAVLFASLIAIQPFRARLDLEKGPANAKWPVAFLSPGGILRSTAVLRSHPSLPILTGIGVSFSIAQTSILAFTATYLVTQCGKTLSEAGHLLAVLLIASTLSRVALGWLADRWGRGLLLLCLLLLAASGGLVLFLLSANGPAWVVYASVALIGATSLGWTGVYMAELARVSPPSLIGEVTSVANLLGFVGSLGGPLIFALYARLSAGFDGPYLLVAAQLVACGLIGLWRYSRHRGFSEQVIASADAATA